MKTDTLKTETGNLQRIITIALVDFVDVLRRYVLSSEGSFLDEIIGGLVE